MPEKAETGRKAGCSKQYIFFNCMQTLWESREEVLRLPYGKLSSPVTRIMNTFMVLNMCQTLDFITYHIQMILSINLSHICQYTHTRAHAHTHKFIYGDFLILLFPF